MLATHMPVQYTCSMRHPEHDDASTEMKVSRCQGNENIVLICGELLVTSGLCSESTLELLLGEMESKLPFLELESVILGT